LNNLLDSNLADSMEVGYCIIEIELNLGWNIEKIDNEVDWMINLRLRILKSTWLFNVYRKKYYKIS
jgi:hypothetical protein